MTSGGTQARCFISYVRADNDAFDSVVDRLKRDLEGRFEARTGRRLEIFLDRDSIGWGEDWRQRIRESVQEATVFIPVVTMRFFQSEACREELLTFTSNAQQLGVTELVLPVILTGAEEISSEDPREEVRLIESLNYKNIEAAWVAGYDSPEWRRMVSDMVRDLAHALEQVEDRLAGQEAKSVLPHGGHGTSPEEDQSDALALTEGFERVTELAGEVVELMTEFASAAGNSLEAVDLGALPPAQAKARLISAAASISGPARRFEEKAGEFEREVSRVDAEIRAIIEEMKAIDHPQAREQVESMTSSLAGFDDMAETLAQMDEMVNVLKMASVVNVSLRKAVRPGIEALRATRNAVATAQSWSALA